MVWHVTVAESVVRNRRTLIEERRVTAALRANLLPVHYAHGHHGFAVLSVVADRWNACRFVTCLSRPACAGDLASEEARARHYLRYA